MSSKEHKEKIFNYIKDIKVGMLTTHDGENMHARPMHLVQDEYDGTIWFFTSKTAEKVFEVHKEKECCLTFSDQEEGIYVSLSGHVTLSQDRDLIESMWSPFVAAWFAKGKDDPDIALLEIKVYKGEHWDAEDSRMLQLYEIAKANVTGDTPDLGENQKFG